MFMNVIIKQKHYNKKKKQDSAFPSDLGLHWKESHHVNTQKNSVKWYTFLEGVERVHWDSVTARKD